MVSFLSAFSSDEKPFLETKTNISAFIPSSLASVCNFVSSVFFNFVLVYFVTPTIIFPDFV
jgi:ABC-type multidrug transport system permease subunit